MPTYEYVCCDCRHHFDVIKMVSEIDRLEECPECCAFCNPHCRQITLPNLDRSAAADWNNPHFSPALGCKVKGDREARQIAKRRGLEEVGTEAPEKIHAKFERDRQERTERRWADADREKVYE